MFNSYRDSLEDVMDSNINDRVPSRNNPLWLLKLSALALQLERVVPLISRLLSNSTKATKNKDKNSNTLSLGNLSLNLPPTIISYDLSNFLLNSNDCKLWKTKKSVMHMSRSLNDSTYNVGQSTDVLSLDSFAVSENNTDDKNNS